MNKIILSVLAMLLSFCSVQAQSTNLGTPKSWSAKATGLRHAPVHNMPAFDLDAQLQADAINEANKIGPWRFGYDHPVSFGLNNGGDWTQLPNGDRIWRIIFRSAGALSMNAIFDQFKLPEGATVYIYSEDRSQFIGAYTSKNNNSEEMLGTSILQGNSMVVEYYEPAAVVGQGKFNIGTVVHGYKSLSLYAEGILKGLNTSGKCNNDVKCPLGVGWENQVNSVAIILVGGSGACTGSLINNTANDGTPYFLTANHCLGGSTAAWVFRFNWDSPTAVCAQNQSSQDPGAPYNEVNGAALRANSAGSDFGLLQLNTTPTGNVYYSGWNRSATAATQATCIHHPDGDIKKISRENQAPTAAAWSGAQTWQIANWDQGTTEPGSSGSPLFDENQRIIGQLYGGGAACNGLTNNGQADYFGRLEVSWAGGGTNATRLSNWLDPSGSNVTTLDGYDPNASGYAYDAGLTQVNNLSGTFCNQSSFSPVLTLRNYGTSAVTSASISYNMDGGSNSNYSWSGSLAPSSSTTVSLPSITVSTDGAHTFNATVTSPNGQLDSNAVNNDVTASFLVVLHPENATLRLTTDAWGSETTWTITNDSSGLVYATGGPYPDNTPNTAYNNVACLAVGCYTFTINDAYGDGIDDGTNTGNYVLISPMGDTLVQMTNAAFGTSTSHSFCVTASPVAVHQTPSIVQNMQVFPNPNKGHFNVALTLTADSDVQLQVYNAMGQLLHNIERSAAAQYNYEIDLSDSAAGMYYVKVIAGDEVLTRKVVKQD